MSGQRFLVLGPLEVRREDGELVALGGPKERLVLALLLARAGAVVAVDTLIDGVWGDDVPRTAERTLHAYVARLRRALEPDRPASAAPEVLVTVGRGYRLVVETGQVDAGRFGQLVDQASTARAAGDPSAAAAYLREALGLWRGEAYAGFEDAAPCRDEARRLAELRRDAFDARIDADLAAGRHLEVVAELEAAVDADPFRERRWGQLVLALYRSGRQRDALDAYQRARTVLVDELGIEPGPELRRLEAAVLAQDPSLDHVDGEVDPLPRRLPAALDAAGTELVGRDAEVHLLRAAWQEAAEGRGSFLSVMGPEGVGKTRLVAELAGEVFGAGALVRYGRCDHSLLGPAALVGAILGDAGGNVGALGAAGVDDGLAPSLVRHLTSLAEGQPSLLVLDDLHTADAATLEFVADLAGWCDAAAVLVVGAFRSEADHVAAPVESNERHVVLGPLDEAEVAAICEHYEPEGWTDAELSQIADASRGLPLRVHELASASVRARVDRRVGDAAERLAASRGRVAVSRAEVAAGVEGVQRLLARRRAQLGRGGVDVPAATCPYQGLARFEADDADRFFGRERLIAELVARTAESSLLAVVGPSGSGKSSVVRAGLLPALEAGALGGRSWRTATLLPGRHPSAALADRRRGVGPAGSQPLLLFVDQFEEVFAGAVEEEDRYAFIEQLLDMAAGDDVVVVIAVRADHLGACSTSARLAAAVSANTVLVGPMEPDELRLAVEGPAQAVGLVVEPGLVELIVGDVGGRAGTLPLVSTALAETWERRIDGTLTVDGYGVAGGVSGALARLAEGAFASLDPDERAAAERVLVRLCDADEGGHGADRRRRLPLGAVLDDGDAAAAAAVGTLVDRRLLTVDDGSVEITHDAVIREWPRLRGWLEEDVQGRRLHRRLADAARAWDEGGRDSSELYRGTRLEVAEEWSSSGTALNRLEREFLDASREAASLEAVRTARQAAERERTNTRLRRLLAGTCVLLVVAAVAGLVAVQQGRRADDEAAAALSSASEAELRLLLGQAEALRTTRRDLALLLAVEAHRMAPGVESGSVLLGMLQSEPGFAGYARGSETGERYLELAFVDDRHVVADAGGGLTVYDLDTNRQVGERVVLGDGRYAVVALATDPATGAVAAGLSGQVNGSPSEGSFDVPREVHLLSASNLLGSSPGGAVPVRTVELPVGTVHDLAFGTGGRLAVGTDAGTAVVVAPSGEVEAVVPVEASGAVSVAYGPDGTLATGNADRIRLWRGAPPTPVAALGRPSTSVDGALAFSDDGRYLVSAGAASTDGDIAAGFGPDFDHLMAWDVSTGDAWPAPAQALCSQVGAVGARAYCVQASAAAETFDLATGARSSPMADLHFEGSSDLAVSPDGRLLAASGTRSAVVASWHLDGGSWVAPIIDRPGGYPTGYRSDGRQLMTESGEPGAGFPVGERRLWDPQTGEAEGSLDVLVAVYALGDRMPALTPDARAVLLDPDGSESALDQPRLDIRNYAVDVAGGRLALGFEDGRVEQWDLTTGRRVGDTIDIIPVEIDPGEGVDSLAYLLGGELLAVAIRDETRFFDAENGAEVRPALAGQSVAAPADGSVFVTTRSDGRITVHDAEDGTVIGSAFQGARGRTNNMVVTDDGRLLLVSSWDGTLRLFDLTVQVQVGRTLAVPFADPITTHLGGTLAPDGSQMAVATPSGVQLWDLDPPGWEASACRLAGRNLTREEWDRYVPGDRPYAATCPDVPTSG